jgi:hypothetical protein
MEQGEIAPERKDEEGGDESSEPEAVASPGDLLEHLSRMMSSLERTWSEALDTESAAQAREEAAGVWQSFVTAQSKWIEQVGEIGERLGVRKTIDRFPLDDAGLAWLTTRAHYSSVRLPKGEVRRFRRDWTMARTSRRDVVVARGVGTGRRWLRSPLGIAYRPELIIHEIEDLVSLPLPPDISPQMREAFLAWRRAAEENDPLAAVVALWECVEFYVSGVSVDLLFMASPATYLQKPI